MVRPLESSIENARLLGALVSIICLNDSMAFCICSGFGCGAEAGFGVAGILAAGASDPPPRGGTGGAPEFWTPEPPIVVIVMNFLLLLFG
jgi:hypothetical protein